MPRRLWHSRKNHEITEVLEGSGKVRSIFQGHSHENDYREIAGIPYVRLVAMVEGSGPRAAGTAPWISRRADRSGSTGSASSRVTTGRADRRFKGGLEVQDRNRLGDMWRPGQPTELETTSDEGCGGSRDPKAWGITIVDEDVEARIPIHGPPDGRPEAPATLIRSSCPGRRAVGSGLVHRLV